MLENVWARIVFLLHHMTRYNLQTQHQSQARRGLGHSLLYSEDASDVRFDALSGPKNKSGLGRCSNRGQRRIHVDLKNMKELGASVHSIHVSV